MGQIRAIFAIVALAVALSAPQSSAQAPASGGPLHVDINQGNLNPMPIAAPDFIGADANTQALGRDLAGVIRADLDRSGLFHSIDPQAFVEHPQALDVPPNFA